MKKKNLLQTVLFVIAFAMMSQFADAGGCACKQINFGCGMGDWVCRYNCGTKCSHGHRIADTASPDEISLSNIYPNPSSNQTTILFTLVQPGKASLKLFDINGRLVKTISEGAFSDGEHEIQWNAGEVEAGIYFIQFQSAEFSRMEKLVVEK